MGGGGAEAEAEAENLRNLEKEPFLSKFVTNVKNDVQKKEAKITHKTYLIHKVGDNSMEMNAVIKSTVGKIHKIPNRNWHFITVQFGFECTHSGREGCCGSHDSAFGFIIL